MTNTATAALSIEAQNALITLAEPGRDGRLQNTRAAIGVTEHDLITRDSRSESGYSLRAIIPARVFGELVAAEYVTSVTNRFGFTYYEPTIAGAEARAAILNPPAQEEEPMTNPAADLSDEAQEVIMNLAVDNAYLHIRNDSRDNYNMFRVEPGGHYRHPNGPAEGVWTVANVWLGAVHDGIIAELKRHDLITCTRESADGRLALRYEATIAGAEARAALIY
mgnify:CR=1 FL=1